MTDFQGHGFKGQGHRQHTGNSVCMQMTAKSISSSWKSDMHNKVDINRIEFEEDVITGSYNQEKKTWPDIHYILAWTKAVRPLQLSRISRCDE